MDVSGRRFYTHRHTNAHTYGYREDEVCRSPVGVFFLFELLIFPPFSQRVTSRERGRESIREGEKAREREALEECQYDWRERGVCVRCAFSNNSSPAVLFHAHSHDPLLPLTCTAALECERRQSD